MCINKIVVLVFFLTLLASVHSWLKCKDTFCGRIRDRLEDRNNVKLDFGATLKVNNKGIEADLMINSQSALRFHLVVIEDSIFHFLIEDPSRLRYRATDALIHEFSPLTVNATKTNNHTVMITHENNKAVVYRSPFKVEFYNNNNLVAVANWNYKLTFERQKHEKTAVALGIQFPNVQHAYGLPLHADSLALRKTRSIGSEPYRLYNLGYSDYDTNSTKALHGSVPVFYAHGTNQSSGVFWLNPSQTWVDVCKDLYQVDAYFMSECGTLEMFVLMGPTLPQAVRQYSKLTGVTPLPPYFALGYHQSRYSHSQYDVIHAANRFLSSDLPVDVIWLDVDFTDGRKYFTWNPRRFPEPHKLVRELGKNFQRTVAIVNPHFKIDHNYTIHTQAKTNGYYVKYSDGTDYSAESLAGTSSWLDFLNPTAREFYSNQHKDFIAIGHSEIHVWNDLNEPKVLSHTLEDTLSPTLIHYKRITHREIHNMYGFYQTMATRDGMLKSNSIARPFTLTRSHFAGSQRYAAAWTGDNFANWEHLRASLSMCLTEALAGISFCGADVGGYEGIPDDELYIRWHQAGAWLPFYRGRYAFYAPSREPYMYETNVQNKIRMTLRQRYAHIPLWYTLFREHELTNEPVIRPITYHYPTEVEALDIDDELLVGSNVLVAPVFERNAVIRHVYLPGGESQIWYNINDKYKMYYGTGYQLVPVNLNYIPVFYRGGSIIPRKDQKRNSTGWSVLDKYTLYICPDNEAYAFGTLYSDKCDGFDYQFDEYLYVNLTFSERVLVSRLDKKGIYADTPFIESLFILNPPEKVTHVKHTVEEAVTTFSNIIEYDDHGKILKITFPKESKIDVKHEFKIELLSENSVAVFKLNKWILIFVVINIVLTKM